jgi:hypothetical protein
MATFAVIENEKVINLIVAETHEIAEEITKFVCVEYADHNSVGIGWSYDGKKFIAPITKKTEAPITPVE